MVCCDRGSSAVSAFKSKVFWFFVANFSGFAGSYEHTAAILERKLFCASEELQKVRV